MTARCTHLVTTECEADNPTRKVLEAMNRQTPVVCEAFIHACIDHGSLVDATPYLLIDHSVTNADTGAGASFSFASSAGTVTTSAKPQSTASSSSLSASSAGARNRKLISTARGSGSVVAVTSNASSEAAARLVMLAHKFEPKRLKDPTVCYSKDFMQMINMPSQSRFTHVEVCQALELSNLIKSLMISLSSPHLHCRDGGFLKSWMACELIGMVRTSILGMAISSHVLIGSK